MRCDITTGVGPEFLGRVRLGSSIASLGGVWIFQNFLKETKISRVLFWTALVAVPLGFTQVTEYVCRETALLSLLSFGILVVCSIYVSWNAFSSSSLHVNRPRCFSVCRGDAIAAASAPNAKRSCYWCTTSIGVSAFLTRFSRLETTSS